jgi:hypothetical protein
MVLRLNHQHRDMVAVTAEHQVSSPAALVSLCTGTNCGRLFDRGCRGLLLHTPPEHRCLIRLLASKTLVRMSVGVVGICGKLCVDSGAASPARGLGECTVLT